jgi:hypothetical protein
MDNQEEKQEVEEAIKEISFCIQTLKDTSLNSSISRDVVKTYVFKLSKEKELLEDYMESL